MFISQNAIGFIGIDLREEKDPDLDYKYQNDKSFSRLIQI